MVGGGSGIWGSSSSSNSSEESTGGDSAGSDDGTGGLFHAGRPYVVRATFEPVEVDHLQLVITSVLSLLGNLRHFPSYSVWSTPWFMQFPRLPFADGRVEQPNHITIYKWLAVTFLIVSSFWKLCF